MTTPHILHMLTPLKHISPFDVNMAADAGFCVISSYANVTQEEVTGLVQDAIFSRPPQDGVKTGIFIAGKDAIAALDMAEAAKNAMVPPFKISVFADPAGSFTTAAAMIACVERTLKRRFGTGLKGQRVAIFGATGVVGFSAAVIAAQQGASVSLAVRESADRVRAIADAAKARFDVELHPVPGGSDADKTALVANSDIVLCAAAAGRRILDARHLAGSSLKIAADVNAVPPSGIEGVDMFANDAEIVGTGAVAIGPLTIGDIKYRTEAGLFRAMIEATEAVHFDFRDAFKLARTLAA